ncbi:MAG: LPS export ABC transporter permease LptF [Pseudomonadota bacterium]
MARFDRYLLSQLLWLFGFFALVLVAVFWINRAVQLFDRLIGDGQSALVFLEFTILGLPRLIVTVLPIATFAATIYVINRLNNESELTVMSATGSSPWRLARPVAVFGLISALMMSVLAHDLVPRSTAQLAEREREVSQNVTARLLQDGTFLNPVPGVTFYTREIGEDGILRDVFVADRRDPAQGMIYTAAESYLVREGDLASLIMVDGLAQRLTPDDLRLSTAKFQDFSFDISSLVSGDVDVAQTIASTGTRALIAAQTTFVAEGVALGALAEEIHTRFARAAFCLVTALIAFSTLLVGGYSRFGVWREIMIAFVLLLLLDGVRSTLSGPVLATPQMWPILYAPAVAGALISAALLWAAARPSLLRRRLRGAA